MVDALRDGEVRALLRLVLSDGWGPRRIRDGLGRFGTAAALVREAGTHLPACPLVPEEEVVQLLARCRREGVTVLGCSDPRFPAPLHHLPDPPPVLFLRGRLEVLQRPCVTLVGSRRSTAYGRRVAGRVGRASAAAGWTVVSGLALGVDGAGHRGALAGGGPTVAVLGNGPDRAHPSSHSRLMTELLETGLVLSEHPPGTPPRAHHFPRRNRILAALGQRTVVVEAATRSGALITARLAVELGREVWAVPGSILSRTSSGTNALIRDGAVPLVSLEGWSRSLVDGEVAQGHPSIRREAEPRGDEVGLRVWRALDGEPRSLEALAASLDMGTRELLPVLTRLELEGWVQRMPGPGFVREVA